MLQGEFPETVMLIVTYNICQLCEHGFYDRFMFRDDTIQYPGEKSTVRHIFGARNGC